MPESLRRVQPVHSHLPDRGAWDEARHERRPRRHPGDESPPHTPASELDAGIDTGAADLSVNLIDVRI